MRFMPIKPFFLPSAILYSVFLIKTKSLHKVDVIKRINQYFTAPDKFDNCKVRHKIFIDNH